ncbi:MAG: hypothetical protein OEW48_10005 [Phycisphaerae bacterium]|nr:hypothetical protein [Phycisphaerae bacterium]
MGTDTKSKLYSRAVCVGIIIIALLTLSSNHNEARAFPERARPSSLTGPWELIVQMGMEVQRLHFPVTVSDENKPEKLETVLPVMVTPIKIRLQHYLPDLTWETTAVKDAKGGIVAKLTVKGENLKQDIWLNPEDPPRQSISSSIGGVAIKKLHDPNTVEKLLHELIDANAAGIVSIWPEDSNSPFEYAARQGETIEVPKSKYKVRILDYVPHYSIDAETKKVVNMSEKPVNPAIKVSVDDGEKAHEQWLWSKFPSSPHKELQLPLRMRFSDFNLGGSDGRYILVAAPGAQPWLLFSKKGKMQAKKAVLGQPYPFSNEHYSFFVEKIFESAVIKTDWKNDSEKLLRPAVIAAIEYDDTVQQAVLEFNKPYHQKTRFGTMVLLYRRQMGSSKATN